MEAEEGWEKAKEGVVTSEELGTGPWAESEWMSRSWPEDKSPPCPKKKKKIVASKGDHFWTLGKMLEIKRTLSHPPTKIQFIWPWISVHCSNCNISKEKEQRWKKNMNRSSEGFKRRKKKLGSSPHSSVITNLTSIHEDVCSIPGLAWWPCQLRIWHCCEIWCRLQMQLGSWVAVAVVHASCYSSDLTPSLGTSIGHKCSP